mmetsp:Transcript_24708/g.59569  ORF Transcript_24708/g.59569 Transcript_24708/m.59569 type:complete len:272 (+) Transcript_24708:2623-3438(+)
MLQRRYSASHISLPGTTRTLISAAAAHAETDEAHFVQYPNGTLVLTLQTQCPRRKVSIVGTPTTVVVGCFGQEGRGEEGRCGRIRRGHARYGWGRRSGGGGKLHPQEGLDKTSQLDGFEILHNIFVGNVLFFIAIAWITSRVVVHMYELIIAIIDSSCSIRRGPYGIGRSSRSRRGSFLLSTRCRASSCTRRPPAQILGGRGTQRREEIGLRMHFVAGGRCRRRGHHRRLMMGRRRPPPMQRRRRAYAIGQSRPAHYGASVAETSRIRVER